MNSALLRRVYLPALLAVIVGLVCFRTDAPRPSVKDGESAPHTAGSEPGLPGADPLAIENFAHWMDRYERVSTDQRSTLLREGLPLAQERRDAVLALMETDPEAALAQALPLAEYAALPDELQPFFARPVSGIGSVDLNWETRMNADGSMNCRHSHTLYLGKESWTAYRAGSAGPHPPQMDVPVSGIVLGDVAVIESGFDQVAANEGGDDPGTPPVGETPFMDDTIDALFIRVDFSDFPGEPVPQGDLETTLAAVKGHIEDFSYNQATLVTTVTPTVYRMPSTGASYAVAGDNYGIQTDARALAAADHTIGDYDVIAVFFPSLGGVSGSQITYGGRASIGGSNHWINGTNSTNTILHEFGHNYGLYHSNYRDPSQSISGRYDVSGSLEYGDIFDRMGNGYAPEGHFNHFAKNLLDWMPDSKVAEANGDGTFRIYRFDHVNALANPTLALKVPMGGDVYYWVGYRQLYTSSSYNLADSAYVVAEGLSEATETNLVDCTPGSQPSEYDDRKDSGLEIGTPFVENGVTFTALGRGGSAPNEWIDVNITFASRVGFAATAVEVDEQSGTAWLTLQRSFSTAGTATIDFATSNGSATAGSDYHANSGTVTWADGDGADKTIMVAIRPDTAAEGTETLTVTLSNPGGASLDATAASATISILDPGERSTVFAPAFFNYSVDAIAPLANGQVLIGGNIYHSSGDFGPIHNLARLNPDGSVDSTFLTGSGFDSTVRAITVQDDGKILVGGSFTSYNGVACKRLIRLDPNGAIDTNISKVDNGTVRTIVVEPSGKILVGGSFSSFDGVAMEGLVRLTAAGARDTGSPLTLPFNTGWGTDIYTLAVQDDDKIMAGGSFYISGGGGFKSGIARLNPSGTRDPSFDPGGGTHGSGSPGLLLRVYALSLLPDEQYLIGGQFTAYDGTDVPHIARLDSNGSLDTSFTPPAFDNNVEALALQPGGKILAGGRFSTPSHGLARLSFGGPVDSTFDVGDGTLDGSSSDPIYTLAMDDNGAVFAGGNFFDWNGASSRPIVKLAGGVTADHIWTTATFTPAQIAAGDADPDADPDGDGVANLVERVFGTPPLTANPDPIFGPAGAATMNLHDDGGTRYPEITIDKGSLATGAWFAAQFSNDLVNWSPDPAQTGPNAVYEILEDSQARFTIRDRSPLSEHRFMRIVIITPE